MSKFRVGDEVRLMESVRSYEGGYSIGDTGAIINAPLSCENWVKLKGDEDVVCGYLKTSALELVEPKSDQDQVKALLKGANIGATMIGDALAKSQEAELTTRYGDRYKQYVDVATKTPLELKIEKCEAKLAKLKGQL